MHESSAPRPTSVAVVAPAEFVLASVLDASALLTWLQAEHGADVVVATSVAGTVISVFSWVEALSKVADTGRDPVTLVAEVAKVGFDLEMSPIEAVTDADAIEIARLRPLTSTRGLSICDRAWRSPSDSLCPSYLTV
jgi:ribonuclease VapC